MSSCSPHVFLYLHIPCRAISEPSQRPHRNQSLTPISHRGLSSVDDGKRWPTLGVILFIAMAHGWLSKCPHSDHVLIFQGILGVYMVGVMSRS